MNAACAPEGPALKLKSYPISTTHFAKFSRFCEVVASANDGYAAVFEAGAYTRPLFGST